MEKNYYRYLREAGLRMRESDQERLNRQKRQERLESLIFMAHLMVWIAILGLFCVIHAYFK